MLKAPSSPHPALTNCIELPMPLLSPTDDTEDPDHSPTERAAAASRRTLVSVAVDLVLTTTQLVAGVLAKSQGLIVDGIHSLSDLVADEDHLYGHHRFETAASIVLGAILLAVGLGMLWSAFLKLEQPETVQKGHVAALWVAGCALVAKELLFRYMFSVAKRVKSSMLVANAWHARSDAASSLVASIGIAGNLAGYPILDHIAASIVGFKAAKMGWAFVWDALLDLMDQSIDDAKVTAIRTTLEATPVIQGVNDIRTRKMGDMIVVDASLSVEAGHVIAMEARSRVMRRHRVLNIMTHVNPWQRPDLDHSMAMP